MTTLRAITLRSRSEYGFTLVEMTITVAIIAMMTAVAIPSLSSVTRLELRKQSRKLSGVIRATYDDAALSGDTHRIVFDMVNNTVKVQRSANSFQLEPGSNALVEASQTQTSFTQGLEEMLMGAEGESSFASSDDDEGSDTGESLSALGSLFNINSLQREEGETSFEDTGSGLELGDNVSIMDVWTEGADKPVAEGSVSLVFFPHGFTQDALVHLQDEAGQVFTIKVWSLTGRAQVFNEYVEVKQ